MYPRVNVLDVGYQYCETMNWQRAAWLVYTLSLAIMAARFRSVRFGGDA
jgi:hypothetical protein